MTCPHWSKSPLPQGLRPQLLAAAALCLLALCMMHSPAWARVPAACQSWPLWEEFRHAHLTADGRVRELTDDGERTTSEGQAYALFFALVAQDRETFERILQWSDHNLGKDQRGNKMMAWLWLPDASGSDGQVQDANAATDADLWLAFSLLEAGRMWQTKAWSDWGETATATMVQTVGTEAYPEPGPVLKPGIWGFDEPPSHLRLNPSYTPPFLMERMFAHTPWEAYRDSADKVLRLSLNAFGRAMDWVDWTLTDGWTAGSGWGSYDAIRVYLWLAMSSSSAHQWGCARSASWLALTQRTGDWLDHWPAEQGLRHASLNAAAIHEAGPGFTATALALAQACGYPAMAKPLLASWISQANQAPRNYYQRALQLFAIGWLEGRFRFDDQGRLHLAAPQRVLLSPRPSAAKAAPFATRAHAPISCSQRT